MTSTMSALKEKLLDRLLGTPEGKQLQAQEEFLALRPKLIEERTATEREIVETVARLVPDLEKAQADFVKKQALADSAKAARDRVAKQIADAKYQAGARVDHINRQLRLNADPRIAEARSTMWARWEKERHSWGKSKEVPTGRRNELTLKHEVVRVSNAGHIQRLVLAIRSASSAFDALPLSAYTDAGAAIAEIEASVDWSLIERFDDHDEPATP